MNDQIRTDDVFVRIIDPPADAFDTDITVRFVEQIADTDGHAVRVRPARPDYVPDAGVLVHFVAPVHDRGHSWWVLPTNDATGIRVRAVRPSVEDVEGHGRKGPGVAPEGARSLRVRALRKS